MRISDWSSDVCSSDLLSTAVSEAGFVFDDVIAGLSAEAEVSAWEKMVTDFDDKLRRLEPVNLAAIAEHAEAAQRKEYLDAQDARSEERRVGKECVRTGRSRGSPDQ